MKEVTVAAVDLGASGGRVMAGRIGGGGLELTEVHRFGNVPVTVRGTIYWDILRLFQDIVHGLRVAGSAHELASVGIDSWGVDYGLLDETGALIANPVHYRDARTDGVAVSVPAAERYAVTGIQHLPFNTICQLAASLGTPALAAARTLLLIPDLLGYWLTGEIGAEVTNASTTALLEVTRQSWAKGLMDRAGIPSRLFPPLRQPGDVVGPVSEESRLANFTNEAGIDGTVRYLRNVTGLWLLQECLRCWPDLSLDPLLAEAARLPALRFVIDPDDPVFLPPGDMPRRILSGLSARGLPVPSGPAEIVRCVLDSLALAYRQAVISVQELSGRHVDVVHIVGGGSRNELLCQLTADALGLPVVAGPAEATALGNVLVQARALNAAPGSLPDMRALVRSAVPLRRFTPRMP